jgi:hypothetical protein
MKKFIAVHKDGTIYEVTGVLGETGLLGNYRLLSFMSKISDGTSEYVPSCESVRNMTMINGLFPKSDYTFTEISK